MKALILDAPRALRLDEVPDPVATGNTVLVRVHAAGVSESDVWGYQNPTADPVDVLGQEIAGTVVGGDMDGVRVVVNPMVTCGECAACLSGRTNLCTERRMMASLPQSSGLAEFVAVPRSNILELPSDVPFPTACLIEPLARGWHVSRMSRRAFPRGRVGLVIGTCAVGLGAKLALQAQGIENVTCVEDNAEVTAEYDIIIDVVSSDASRALASGCVAAGGVIGLAGLASGAGGLDLGRLSAREVTVMCTTAYTSQDFHDTAQAVFDGRLGPLDWVDVRPLADGPAVFEELAAGRASVPRVVLTPSVA